MTKGYGRSHKDGPKGFRGYRAWGLECNIFLTPNKDMGNIDNRGRGTVDSRIFRDSKDLAVHLGRYGAEVY